MSTVGNIVNSLKSHRNENAMSYLCVWLHKTNKIDDLINFPLINKPNVSIYLICGVKWNKSTSQKPHRVIFCTTNVVI